MLAISFMLAHNGPSQVSGGMVSFCNTILCGRGGFTGSIGVVWIGNDRCILLHSSCRVAGTVLVGAALII